MCFFIVWWVLVDVDTARNVNYSSPTNKIASSVLWMSNYIICELNRFLVVVGLHKLTNPTDVEDQGWVRTSWWSLPAQSLAFNSLESWISSKPPRIGIIGYVR